MKQNKPTLIVLTVAVIILWSTIGFKIHDAVTVSDVPDQSSTAPHQVTSAAGGSVGDLDWSIRDPFRFESPVPVRHPALPRIIPVGIPYLPPTLRLTGILENDRGRTAVFEGKDGAILYAKEGEELEGMKVQRITPRSVEYTHLNRKGSFSLE